MVLFHLFCCYCCCSVAKLYPTRDPMNCSTLGSSALCPSGSTGVCTDSCPLSQQCNLTISSSAPSFSFCLQSFPASGLFSDELALHIRWLKYQSFNFSISPYSEYLGLISFRFDWFDLLAVQGTLKNLLQHQNSKASILWHSVFFLWSISHICTSLLEKP